MTTETQKLRDIEAKLARRGKSLEFLQMITRTLASLSLTDKDEIADTLSSMVATFHGANTALTILLRDDEEGFRLAARLGDVDEGSIIGPEAGILWARILDERTPRYYDRDALDEWWPDRPDSLRGGLAAAAIELRDEGLGVLATGVKRSAAPYTEEDLEFLAGVISVGAMALANAESLAAQQAAMRDAERQAEDARRLAEEREVALAELDQKLEIIRRQQSAIRELSTPVLQLWENVLALPIIGVVDTKRAVDIMERLLTEVTERQSRFVILDITGVDVVDTKTADHFIKVMKAAELLGTKCILTGIRPAVAQTLVEIGVDLDQIETLRNLKEGLEECLRKMAHDKREPGVA